MRPLRLFLDGFGSYRHPAEADFSDVDFFALTGPTGSGKSTLIDGLCFALYGTVPRWGNEGAIAEALAPAATGCRVCLVFETGGKRYAAVRALARDKRGQVHTREARLDLLDPAIPPDAPLETLVAASVEHLAEGPDQVKSRGEGILGLSYEHFIQSVLLPQGRFSDFLQAEPRKRQDLLVELLAFGVYEEVGQRARERARLAAERMEVAQRDRNDLAGATEEAEAQAAARVEDLNGLSLMVGERVHALDKLTDRARQAEEQGQATQKETDLLAAIHTPAGVAALADRIAKAEKAVSDRRKQAEEAENVEEDADRTRAALPDRAWMEAVGHRYRQHRTVQGRLREQEQEQAASRDAESAHAQQLEAADKEAKNARCEREAAQKAHAAQALAEHLQVGEECPVCLQPVAALPLHPPVPALREVAAVAKSAEKKLEQARSDHQEALTAAEVARSAAEDTRRQLGEVVAALAGAPSEGEVVESLEAIAKADEAVRRARDEARARRKDADSAEKERQSLATQEQEAWNELRNARDSVVSLGAPPVEEGDLAAGWEALATWASRQKAVRTEHLERLQAGASLLQKQVTQDTAALIRLLAAHRVTDVADPAQAPAAVVGHRVQAENDLAVIRRDRDRAARLDEQIRTNAEEAQVANELGRLLRATSFERWLCSEALDSLVTEASGTLMELSAGQYQLDRDDRNELVVIDHQDAGARRAVHTLSGGETFQASLALALALSRQVVGLSAGMRDLDSVFLDEGFGTLDEETLETVAATLEQLTAAGDRMVGIITHVAALADRVPVRFVVSRDGASSALRKERL